MIYNASSGHLGGSYSIVEILVALYYRLMNVDPERPQWEERDILVLSKGHTAPALYAVLASRGYFDKELLFSSYRRLNSSLQGHPDMKKTPGIDMSTGSLGIGLSAACGYALARKRQLRDHVYVYAIVGDGETNEGCIWEAAMFASHHRLDNLIVFVDMNGLQNDGYTEDVMDMRDMSAKWEAFGWRTEKIDGHDIGAIVAAVERAKADPDRPAAIICQTIKGKGVSFMERSIRFHGSCPTPDEYERALKELASAAAPGPCPAAPPRP